LSHNPSKVLKNAQWVRGDSPLLTYDSKHIIRNKKSLEIELAGIMLTKNYVESQKCNRKIPKIEKKLPIE
jgi:hypothetical protein